MITRSISVDKKTWQAAISKAKKEHLSLSYLIRQWLKEWVSESQEKETDKK